MLVAQHSLPIVGPRLPCAIQTSLRGKSQGYVTLAGRPGSCVGVGLQGASNDAELSVDTDCNGSGHRPGFHTFGRSELAERAYDLGWDMAHFGVKIRDNWPRIQEYAMLGWSEGSSHFYGRTKPATAFDKKWLRLRGSALHRGKICHESVTPEHLQLIAPPYCPVMRSLLCYDGSTLNMETDSHRVWSVDRLNNQGAYIEGNLVVMSDMANRAKNAHDYEGLKSMFYEALAREDKQLDGLTASQWGRLASLASSMAVTDANWKEVATFPHLAVAPNLVMLHGSLSIVMTEFYRNAFQMKPIKFIGWWSACFTDKKMRKVAHQAASAFVTACERCARDKSRTKRWVMEDAWCNPGFQQIWAKMIDRMELSELDLLVKGALSLDDFAEWRRAAGLVAL